MQILFTKKLESKDSWKDEMPFITHVLCLRHSYCVTSKVAHFDDFLLTHSEKQSEATVFM